MAELIEQPAAWHCTATASMSTPTACTRAQFQQLGQHHAAAGAQLQHLVQAELVAALAQLLHQRGGVFGGGEGGVHEGTWQGAGEVCGLAG